MHVNLESDVDEDGTSTHTTFRTLAPIYSSKLGSSLSIHESPRGCKVVLKKKKKD
jgi:hypothetical protein